MDIIHAILEGERDATKLSELCFGRVKKSKEEIALALNGFYRSDYLFQLKQQVKTHGFLQEQIEEVDRELICMMLERHLHDSGKDDLAFEQKKKDKKKIQKNNPGFEIDKQAFQLFNGVNLMEVPGISYGTVLVFVSEIGENINKFPTAKALFCSWLRLTPNKKISGGKVIGNNVRHGVNVMSTALRNAANTVGNMKADIPLTKFFKRLAFKYGRAAAISATARKLGVIIWNMITKEQSYQQPSNELYDQRIRQITLKNIQRKISKLKIQPHDLHFVNA